MDASSEEYPELNHHWSTLSNTPCPGAIHTYSPSKVMSDPLYCDTCFKLFGDFRNVAETGRDFAKSLFTINA